MVADDVGEVNLFNLLLGVVLLRGLHLVCVRTCLRATRPWPLLKYSTDTWVCTWPHSGRGRILAKVQNIQIA